MNTLRKSSVLLPLLLLLLSSCTGGDGTSDTQPVLTWGKGELCIENPIAPADTLCYHIEFRLDTLAAGTPLAESLARTLSDSILTATAASSVMDAIRLTADSIEHEWKTELAEQYDPESEWRETLQYYYTVEGSPTDDAASDSILSYQVTTDCYLGGAHGSYVIFYYNFDKKTGKLIGLRDVVPQEKEAAVLQAMEKQLCEDWQAKDMDDLREQTGITMLADLYIPNNFLLRGDSIEFLFNQYEIAPYAAGLIGVTLPRP